MKVVVFDLVGQSLGARQMDLSLGHPNGKRAVHNSIMETLAADYAVLIRDDIGRFDTELQQFAGDPSARIDLGADPKAKLLARLAALGVTQAEITASDVRFARARIVAGDRKTIPELKELYPAIRAALRDD